MGIASQVMQNITTVLYYLISKRTGNDLPAQFNDDDLRFMTSQLKLSSTRLLDLLWDEEAEAEEEDLDA